MSFLPDPFDSPVPGDPFASKEELIASMEKEITKAISETEELHRKIIDFQEDVMSGVDDRIDRNSANYEIYDVRKNLLNTIRDLHWMKSYVLESLEVTEDNKVRMTYR